MTKLNEYQGKLAMVTGAGDGIGEMLAKQLASSRTHRRCPRYSARRSRTRRQ